MIITILTKKSLIIIVALLVLSVAFITPVYGYYAEYTAGTNMAGYSTNTGIRTTWQGSWSGTKYADASSFSYDNSDTSQSGIGVNWYKTFVYFDTRDLPHYYFTNWVGGNHWHFDDVNYTITDAKLSLYFTTFHYFFVVGNHTWRTPDNHWNYYGPTFPLAKACNDCIYDCPCDNTTQCLFSDKTMANSGWTDVTLGYWGKQDIGQCQDSLNTHPHYQNYGVTGYGIMNSNQLNSESNTSTQTIVIEGAGSAHPPVLKIWYEDADNDTFSFTSIDGGGNGTIITSNIPVINWTVTSNAIKYSLQIATDSSFTNIVTDLADINIYNYPTEYNEVGSTVSFTLPSANALSVFQTYYFRVRAYR